MIVTTRNVDRKNNNSGFTLVEIIVVIAIMSILFSVIVPSFIGYVERAKEQVCNANSLQLERMYNLHLMMEDTEHTEVLFTQYLQEFGQNICPDHGDISYLEGKVQCSIHPRVEVVEIDDDDDGSVPFL